EEVGTPADMDTAMRLGFNWPLGPVEISELIGAARAAALLEDLRQDHGEAYAPAASLLPATGGGDGARPRASDGADRGAEPGGRAGGRGGGRAGACDGNPR